MRFHLFQLLFLLSFLPSCNNAQVFIKHVDELTEIDSVKFEKRIQINRTDNFILYNYNNADTVEVKTIVKEYSKRFSNVYDNYTMNFYKHSVFADTNYIKKFDQQFAYKALIDEEPLFIFQWWGGKLILKPDAFKHW